MEFVPIKAEEIPPNGAGGKKSQIRQGIELFIQREEIVRCQDCEYASDDGLTSLWCSENFREVRRNGFCAWGERKEQDNG